MDTVRLTLLQTGYVRAEGQGYISAFGAYLAACKGAGGRYDAPSKTWSIPPAGVGGLVTELTSNGFAVDVPDDVAGLTKVARSDAEAAIAIQQAATAAAVDRGRAVGLFSFQVDGVSWLAPRTSALLADEMGLGKTAQTLVALPDGAPVLIVAPAVAKGVWRREIARWRPERANHVAVLSGRGSFRWPEPGETIITNYDILPDPAPKTAGKEWEVLPKGCAPPPHGLVLVCDEAHNCKNNKAKRTRTVRQMGWQIRANGGRTWMLTATPMLGKPPELWSIAQCCGIARKAWGGWGAFMAAFDGHETRFGIEWGTHPTSAAARGLETFQLRRRRLEVLPDLPGKRHQWLDVEIDAKTRRACDKAIAALEAVGVDLTDADAVVKAASKGTTFEQISRARAALASAKAVSMIPLVEEYEEAGEPLVVFSTHRAPIDALATREGWAAITGDTAPDERSRIEDAFQRGELLGVAATIKAGGVAITLTHASHAVFVDQEWTPALNAQAEDRICRIGQTRGCLIQVLVAEHQLDRRIAELLGEKQSRINHSVEEARVIQATVTLPPVVEANHIPVPPPPTQFETDTRDRYPRNRKLRNRPDNVRGPQTEEEQWAAAGVLTLADLDPDRALHQNAAGFNKPDGGWGHCAAHDVANGGLTDSEWERLCRMLRKYHRQIGERPATKREAS